MSLLCSALYAKWLGILTGRPPGGSPPGSARISAWPCECNIIQPAVNCVSTFQPRYPSTGWHRRRRRNGTANQYTDLCWDETCWEHVSVQCHARNNTI